MQRHRGALHVKVASGVVALKQHMFGIARDQAEEPTLTAKTFLLNCIKDEYNLE